jgi:hypothetical protein
MYFHVCKVKPTRTTNFSYFHKSVFQTLSVLLEFKLLGIKSSVSTFGVTCCLFRQGENKFVCAATNPNSVTLKAETAFISKRRNTLYYAV